MLVTTTALMSCRVMSSKSAAADEGTLKLTGLTATSFEAPSHPQAGEGREERRRSDGGRPRRRSDGCSLAQTGMRGRLFAISLSRF